MLTVMELLSFPLFRKFRLVSGYGGLYNQVTGTGIFEWESSTEVEKNFEQGEFVVTTLSLSRSDTAQAENSIRMLIDKKVSAIAIKEIYFQDISQELKEYSNIQRVPVFFFSETFFDDIIYTVKNTLITHKRDFDWEEQIDFLLENTNAADQRKRKAAEINPFFHSNIICSYAGLKNGVSLQDNRRVLRPDPEQTVYTVLGYRRGVLVIYTEKDAHSIQERLMGFLEKSGLKLNLEKIGMSSSVKGLENLGTAIQESLYAYSSGRLGQAEISCFQNTGLDQILMPVADNLWVRKYYERTRSAITAYDAKHGAKLMDTLLEYVDCCCDIKLTSQKLYQHGNTIRYRIEKIRRLMSLEDDSDSRAQLILFARLHRIYEDSEST